MIPTFQKSSNTTFLNKIHFRLVHSPNKTNLSLQISPLEFQDRQRRLLAIIPSTIDICIIPGYGLRYATHNIFYNFHQNTNLLYLCGLNEPDSGIVLEKDPNSTKSHKLTIYLQPRNKEMELWDGPRIGLEGALKDYGADEVFLLQDVIND